MEQMITSPLLIVHFLKFAVKQPVYPGFARIQRLTFRQAREHQSLLRPWMDGRQEF
jgi:hypothetical protein